MAQYTLYGLGVESDIDLPGAMTGDPERPADVEIRQAALPARLERVAGGHADGEGGFILNIEGTARYWVRNGREIRIELLPGGRITNMRLFLMGSAIGALLYLRGFLLIHANAIVIEGRAVALAGPSGSGKSTLAMEFARRGYAVLSDDICALGPHGLVEPGWRRMRLWDDALDQFAIDASAHPLTYVGDPEYRKHDVDVPQVQASASPLASVMIMDRNAGDELRPLGSAEAAIALFGNLYRGEFLEALGGVEKAFRRCAELSGELPVYRFRRSHSLSGVAQDAERIVNFFSGTNLARK